MKMNKKILFVLPLAISLSLLSGCGKEEEYNPALFKASINKEYQVLDNFDEYDVTAFYGNRSLDPHEFVIDASGFDSSKAGETRITVSPLNRSYVKYEIPIQIKNRHSANVLSIGTGFSDDLTYYANELANNSSYEVAEGEDPIVMDYNFYSVSVNYATIDDHYRNLYTGDKIYTLSSYDKTSSSWTTAKNKSLKEALTYKGIHWDFIVLQADPIEAGIPNAYESLDLFSQSILRLFMNQNRVLPALVWDFIWAFEDNVQINSDYYQHYDNSQSKMYDCISRSVNQEITCLAQFKAIAPTGTIIQNARTSGITSERDYTTDGKALTQLGKYLASMGLVTTISGFDCAHFTYTGEEQYTIVTESEYQMALKAVQAAMDKPFEVTDISDDE